MRQAIGRFALLSGFLLLACVGAFSQANSEPAGNITDQNGAVVPGARVLLINPPTNSLCSSRRPKW